MTSRTLVILAGVLVALALLAMLGGRDDAPPSRSGELLLPELGAALGEIDRVQLAGPGATTGTTLERLPDHWAVAEKQGYPADIGKIREALRSLADARIVEEMTSNPAYYDRLGVADVDSEEARGVELSAFAAGAPQATVIIGDAVGGEQQYVRESGEPTSYLVDVALDVTAAPSDWLDRLIIDIPSTQIESVSIEHPDGETLRVFKASAEQTNFDVADIPEGRELSYPGVANVIGNTLRDLRLEDVRPAADSESDEDGDAADQSRTTAAFRTFDGLVVTATAIEHDGETWVRFDARAEEPPTLAAESSDANDAPNGSGEENALDTADSDSDTGTARRETGGSGSAAEEARAINARLDGWEYKLPAYQVGQLTRRIDDLLRAEEDGD